MQMIDAGIKLISLLLPFADARMNLSNLNPVVELFMN